MTAYSLKYFEENAGRIVKEASENLESIYITLDNGESVILMPAQKFESLNETEYLLSNPVNAERLLKAAADIRSGQFQHRDITDQSS